MPIAPSLSGHSKTHMLKTSILKALPIVAAGILLLMSGGEIRNFLERLELQHFSNLQATLHENRYESKIDIIGIDNETISAPGMRKLFGRFPYRRDVYAYLLHFLSRSGKGMAPKTFVFDMSFDGGEDMDFPERDAALAHAVQDAPFPVLSSLNVTFLNKGQTQDPDSLLTSITDQKVQVKGPLDKIGVIHADAVTRPISPLLQTSMRFFPAHAVLFDQAHIVRTTVPFIVLANQQILPSLPLGPLLENHDEISVLSGTNLRIGDRLLDFKGESYPIIHWYGDVRGNMTNHRNRIAGSETYREDGFHRLLSLHSKSDETFPVYRKYSLWSVLRSELGMQCQEKSDDPICQKFLALHLQNIPGNMPLISPQAFSGHYVYLGQTVENGANSDTHQTVYPGANYPGVYIQANILDNYLHNDFVRRAGSVWTWLCTIGVVMLALYACLHWRSLLMGLLFVGLLAAGYTCFTYWAYQHWNLWVNWVYPMTALLLTILISYLIRYTLEERRRRQLRFAFGKYVSPAAMMMIEKNAEDLTLGGQRRELTMLFCDIRGFTAFSEKNPPEVIQEMLTEYFTVMNDIILNTFGGSINKLMGDAIMAYWGFPLTTEDHAFLAVSAALEMKAAMHRWLADPAKPQIKIGIGINTGDVMIGNIGSKDFMDFTVIGDAVNIASRLEGLNKELGSTIVISEATYEKIKDRINARFLDKIRVRGKEQATPVYEPLETL